MKAFKTLSLAAATACAALLTGCSGSASDSEEIIDYVAIAPGSSYGGNSTFALANLQGDVIELPENLKSVRESVNGIFSAREDGTNDYYFYTAEATPRRIGEGYAEVGAFTGKYAPVVTKAGDIQYLDREGNVAFDLVAHNAGNFFCGRALIMASGLYGYIDEQGELVIPAEYVKAEHFSEGYAVVWKSDDEWAIIDVDGKEVVSETKDHLRPNLDGNVQRELVQGGYLVAISPDEKEWKFFCPSDPDKTKTETSLEPVRIYSNFYNHRIVTGLGVLDVKENCYTADHGGASDLLPQYADVRDSFFMLDGLSPAVKGFGSAVVGTDRQGETYLVSPSGSKKEAPIFKSRTIPFSIDDMVME